MSIDDPCALETGALWPAMTSDEANAVLCGAGAPFETEIVGAGGRSICTWKNAIPTLAALAEVGRTHGASEFLVYGKERVTYEGWYRAVATLAGHLRALGVGKGDRVALAMRNLPEWPVAFFAVTTIGAICVPLNAWWTGAELAFGIGDSESRILICDEDRYTRLVAHFDALPSIEQVIVSRAAQIPDAQIPNKAIALESLIGTSADYAALPAGRLPAEHVFADDPATILYTSGTTGFPKGALNTHRNLTSHIQTTGYFVARALLLRGASLPAAAPPPVLLIAIPLFHVSGCAAGMLGAIATGGKIVLMHKWDAEQALQLIQDERVTFTGGVPTIAWQLIDHPARGRFDLSSLMSVGYGGAPSAAELVEHIHDDLGAMPGNGWGMTETSGTVISHIAEEYMQTPTSCGVPVPVADVKIMAEDGVTELVCGEVGELWATGPMVIRGYWRNPEADAATFTDGWVRTGDLARRDERGYYYIVDRIKDMILRGGENIYTAEVENIFYAHPAVVDASVIGVPHRTLGEEPVAAVALGVGAVASEDELQQWARERLAAFKCPVRIIIHPGELPRNANGKVMKDQIRALFARCDHFQERDDNGFHSDPWRYRATGRL